MKLLKLPLNFVVLFFINSTLGAYDLRVVVTGMRNQHGELQVSLYNKDGTIPDKELKNYYKTKRVKIEGKETKVLFSNLPKGRYAVNVFHDENNNHKIDKGFILPKEGVGLSNFETVNFFNLPDFQKASFLLEQDKTVQIKLIYF